jgi:hypothetical protein
MQQRERPVNNVNHETRQFHISAIIEEARSHYNQLLQQDLLGPDTDLGSILQLANIDRHGEVFAQSLWQGREQEVDKRIQELHPFLQDEILQMQPWVARAVSQRETPTQSWTARVAAEPESMREVG